VYSITNGQLCLRLGKFPEHSQKLKVPVLSTKPGHELQARIRLSSWGKHAVLQVLQLVVSLAHQ